MMAITSVGPPYTFAMMEQDHIFRVATGQLQTMARGHIRGSQHRFPTTLGTTWQ